MRSPLSGRARAEVVAVPAPGHHLGEGVVVEGRVLAWLFGINLLRVRADVVLVPADVRPVDRFDVVPTGRSAARDPAAATGTRAVRPSTDGGDRLRDARMLLRETDALLEHVGSRHPSPGATSRERQAT